VCLFHFTRIYIDRKVALCVAVIAAFNPFIYSYSWEARSYSLTLLFGSMMLWLFWLSMTENCKRHWILYGLVAGVGLYSHIFLALMIVSQFGFALTYTRLQGNFSKYFNMLLMAGCLLTLIAAPLLYFFITVGSQASNIDWIKPVGISHTWSFLKNILKTNNSWDMLPRITSALLLVSCFGIASFIAVREYLHDKLSKPAALILYLGMCTLVPVILTYALQLIKPVFIDRYLIFVAPPFLILCCWSILSLSKKYIRHAALCCLCLTQAHGLYDSHYANKYAYDELYSELSVVCKPGSSLMFSFSSVATSYYYYQAKYPRLAQCFSAVSPPHLDYRNFNQVLEIEQLHTARPEAQLWVIDGHVYGKNRSIDRIHDEGYLAEHNYSHAFYKKYPLDLVLIELGNEAPQAALTNLTAGLKDPL
jgi:uncharacterized membrane protein